MIRILIANDLLKGGGVENVLENLTRYLMQHGYEVTLMIPNCSEYEARSIFGEHIKVYPSMRELKNMKKYSLQWFGDRGLYLIQKQIYRNRLSAMKYDVMIALKEGPIMKELAWINGKKYAWVHVDYRFMHWTEGCFKSNDNERKCMQRFDKVVCVSQATADSIIETIGDPGNLCVKYNPINVDRIVRFSKQPCNLQKISEKFLFVSVGRLDSQKNYFLLLDVCSSLSKKYDFELWIIGDGPDRQGLEEKIQKLSIPNVKLLGNQNNPYPYIKAADAFISVSTWESYGLAIQEALILGVPVITTECPAIKEVFDTRFGLLINNTFSALYDSMDKMIKNPNLCKEYRHNIEQYYNTESLYEKRSRDICNLWEQNYEE